MRALAIVALLVGVARAQPGPADAAAALREANAAATAGDWSRVSVLVQPLLVVQLERADLAEAHRLAGLYMFFAHREAEAETHFLAYLKIDLDAHLDPALYPPEVVGFFENVRAKHGPELHALRPRPKRTFILNFVPPFGQFQNGERAKGWVLTGLFGAFAIADVSSYFALRSWCTRVTGASGSSLVCDRGSNHDNGARLAQYAEIVSGVGLILTYVYGVYDGVAGYRRQEQMAPFANPVNGGGVVGIAGSF